MLTQAELELLELPPPTMSSRLLLLGCSTRKRTDHKDIPAIDRYDGPLWQTLRVHDADGTRCQVGFVSALFGIGCARTGLMPNYDFRLTSEGADHWARTRMPPPRPHACRGRHVTNHKTMASMRNRAAPVRRFTEVALCGGADYLKVMQAELAWTMAMMRDPMPRVVVINDTIGNMRHKLGAWLKQGEVTA